jgi:nitrogen regulatory protein P-II 2
MKFIMAIIKPSKLDAVREALSAADVHGMTVSEVRGYGRQKGHSEIYRGAEYQVSFIPKLKLEIAVSADQADNIVDIIRTTAESGKIGDGKIFMFDLEKITRIRTGETGETAL